MGNQGQRKEQRSERLLDEIGDACRILFQREVAAVEQLHARHFVDVVGKGPIIKRSISRYRRSVAV
ncbi:MAG: hypothetical protein H7Z19_21060 [Chitinophagaceae bacterium]|nr:hypothetical protein [Rubrivivax sp.]